MPQHLSSLKQYDYLVVGQGLAGSLFAHHLKKNHHTFQLIDSGQKGASHVCVGMYNPVVLRRYAEVWQAESQIDYMQAQIQELAELLGQKLDYPQPIYRLFNNENDRQAWAKKAKELTTFLSEKVVNECHSAIHSPLGMGEVKMSGRIEVKTLLNHFREQLQLKQQLIVSEMDYQALNRKQDKDGYGFEYQGNRYRSVVCCEGFGIKNNPFFNYLPLNGNKGEVLYINAPKLNLSAIIKCGIFIAPTAKPSIYVVGATYDWDNKDCIPTEQAKQTLINKLTQFLSVDFEVVNHYAGIRPTVTDRRPLLGEHPNIRNLYILNGLGTRGIMLAPTMAQHLYQYIQQKTPLPEAVNIQRFNKTVFN